MWWATMPQMICEKIQVENELDGCVWLGGVQGTELGQEKIHPDQRFVERTSLGTLIACCLGKEEDDLDK